MHSNRWMVVCTLIIALFATAAAHAEQRPYPPARAAVVVLSYEDEWWSYAGEYPFVWTVTQQLAAKYSSISILHGQKSTPKYIGNALAAALKRKIPVDLFMSTHSNEDSIYLAPLDKPNEPDTGEDGWVNPVEFLKPYIREADKQYLQLVVNFGCENVSPKMVDGFVQDLGFKAYVGNNDVSTGAYEMTRFFDEWMNCSDLSSAVADVNEDLTDTFNNYTAPRKIYQEIAMKKTYTNLMQGYGENLELCQPGQYRNRYSDY